MFDEFQAKAPTTVKITEKAFAKQDSTSVYWLGGAGILLNCRGTTVMVDPTIFAVPDSPFPGAQMRSEVSIKPLMDALPIEAAQVKKLDAVLFTHSDDDHMGFATAPILLNSGAIYYGTQDSANKLMRLGIPEDRIRVYKPLDRFQLGEMTVELTHAYHPWQQLLPEGAYIFTLEDCCGYKFHTPDGVVWHPGDTWLLDEHLLNTDVDVMMADFSDDKYHFGRENALKLVNTLKDTQLLMYHYGTLYSPNQVCYNANPADIIDKIQNPGRFHLVAPGEEFIVKPKAK